MSDSSWSEAMVSTNDKIDALIQSGWDVLDSDFNVAAFKRWRTMALDCLVALVGPHHVYTQFFEDWVRCADRKDLVAGEGILIAAQHVIPKI
jgi:hypothetical protein